MSTEIGTLKNTGSRGVDMSLTRFWGGDNNGVCVQLTATMEEGEGGYVQLSASDLIALYPILKMHIIDVEMERKIKESDRVMAECKEARKSLISDMRDVCAMARDTEVLDVAQLLCYGKRQVILSDDIIAEMEAEK